MNQGNTTAQDELQQAINSITSGASATENGAGSSEDVVSQITSKIAGEAAPSVGSAVSDVVSGSAGIFTPPETPAAEPVATPGAPKESVAPEAPASSASILPPAPAPEIPPIEAIVPPVASTPVAPAVVPAETTASAVEAPVAEAATEAVSEAPKVPSATEILDGLAKKDGKKTEATVDLSGLEKVKSEALTELRPILEKVDAPAEKKFMVYKDIIETADDKSCIEPAYKAAKEIADEKEKAEALLYVVEAIDGLDEK